MKKKIKINLSNNNKKIIIVTISVIVVFLIGFILKNTSFINKLFANVDSSNRDYFEDQFFYTVIINSYNNENGTQKKYDDILTDSELASIKEIDSGDVQGDTSDLLKSAKGIEKLTGLTKLDLSNNTLTEIDLSHNTKLTQVNLSDNALSSITFGKNDNLSSLDLSNNYLNSLDISNLKSLSSLDLEDNPVFLDIILKEGESFSITDNITLPSGTDVTYSVGNNSVATLDGNVVTAVSNGETYVTSNFGNFSISRKVLVGDVTLLTDYDNAVINEDNRYVYLRTCLSEVITDNYLQQFFSSNAGTLKFSNNKMYLMANNGILKEYDLVYINANGLFYNSDYIISESYVNDVKEFNKEAINCAYELINNEELIVKHDGNEIDRLKIVYIYLPKSYLLNADVLYTSTEIIDESKINNITSVNEIDENKINVLSNNGVKARISGISDDNLKALEFYEESHSESTNFLLVSLHSDKYDLSKDYIYVKNNDFNLDLSIIMETLNSSTNEFEQSEFSSEQLISLGALRLNNNYMELYFGMVKLFKVKQWKFVQLSSDKYDLDSDTINLGGDETLDTSSIDIKNGTISIEGDTLVIKFEDEVVDEIKIVGGKKSTTTTSTKPETTTSNVTSSTTSKKPDKTTTTKVVTTTGENKTTVNDSTTKNSVKTSKRITSTTKVIKNRNEVENKQNNIQNRVHNSKRIIIIIVNIINLLLLLILFSMIYKKYRKQ